MRSVRKKFFSLLFLGYWESLTAAQPLRFISMIDRVLNPNGFGLQSCSQRQPSEEEIAGFQSWIQDATRDNKAIQVIFGDRGSHRFHSPAFQEAAGAVLFIDSALEPQDPYSTLPRSFGCCCACSDFLEFLKQKQDLFSALKGHVTMVFDDWSLLPYENYNYGCGTDPVTPMSGESKLFFLHSLLSPSGRIFTATNFMTETFLFWAQESFDCKICRLDVRTHPELAFAATPLTDTQSYSTLPEWILSPRDLAIQASYAAGSHASSEALTAALASINWAQDLIDFYFADGKFGDRFMVCEKLDISDSDLSESYEWFRVSLPLQDRLRLSRLPDHFGPYGRRHRLAFSKDG